MTISSKFHPSEPGVNPTASLPSSPEPEIVSVLDAFNHNHTRLWALRDIPMAAAVGGMQWERAVIRTLLEKFRRPYPLQSDELRKDFMDAVKAEFERPTQFPGHPHNALMIIACDWETVFSRLDFDFPHAEVGAATLFESQLIAAWTMFETLAGDLWVKAVNSLPDPLALLAGDAARISGKLQSVAPPDVEQQEPDASEDDSSELANSEKKITLGMIHRVTRGKFDLGDKMGDLLVATERVKFASLFSIREAYSLAFSEKYKTKPMSIDAALSSKELDAVSLVRNVIVHKAGVADTHYVEDSKAVPSAPKLTIGERLGLDVDKLQALVNPVVLLSAKLITAVDRWMKLKRKKPLT